MPRIKRPPKKIPRMAVSQSESRTSGARPSSQSTTSQTSTAPTPRTVSASSEIIVPPSRTASCCSTQTTDSRNTASSCSVITVAPEGTTGSCSNYGTDSRDRSTTQETATPISSNVTPRVARGRRTGSHRRCTTRRYSARIMPRCLIPVVSSTERSKLIGSIIVHREPEQTPTSSSTHLSAAGISPQVPVTVTSANTKYHTRSKGAVTSPIAHHLPSSQKSAHSPSNPRTSEATSQTDTKTPNPPSESPASSRHNEKTRKMVPDFGGQASGDYEEIMLAPAVEPAEVPLASEQDSSSTSSNDSIVLSTDSD